jgi:membrane-associated phospholipid phosphatase
VRDPLSMQTPWAVALRNRVYKNFLLTVVSTTAITSLFFVAYFAVQRHPAFKPIMMPRTELDWAIPFQPAALVAYLSVWIYVGVGPGLQRTIREFAVYGLWLCGLLISGLGIFYFWPTQVPVPALAATSFPGFAMLHRVDATSNACPSMHVAVAIFTAVRIDEALRSMRTPLQLRVVNAAWFAVIAYSTLAIKQHVVLDVVAGALLGLIFAVLSLRWRPGPEGTATFLTLAVPSQAETFLAPVTPELTELRCTDQGHG